MPRLKAYLRISPLFFHISRPPSLSLVARGASHAMQRSAFRDRQRESSPGLRRIVALVLSARYPVTEFTLFARAWI